MFQDYALFPHRNVSENISFGLRMQNRPKPEIDKRVDAALETINMAEFASHKVTDLSGEVSSSVLRSQGRWRPNHVC